MELWTEVRRRVLTGEISRRQACSEYQLHWQTLQKILGHVEPPGYRGAKPRQRRKMERFLPLIAEILLGDAKAPKKQRHTAQRIFDRLVEEHAFDGCCSSVKEAVRAWRQGRQEVFLPLSHPPGEAQVDFGFADMDLAGERTKAALFVMTLPYSDAVFVQAFPRECTEAFQEGHRRAFEFFGGVPTRISYDNCRVAITKITGGRSRQLTSEFLRLQSHYLFQAPFCLVRRANEKGKVEGGLTPMK
ncbi:MAG: IS21 family transposase [Pirellulales bacterium]|nr:IS21 family transposase [Pirellulales bacterium]